MTTLDEIIRLTTEMREETIRELTSINEKNSGGGVPRVYRIVREEYVSRFEEAVNKFILENPEYELSSDPLHVKQSGYYHAVFKLKPTEEKKPESTIEIKE